MKTVKLINDFHNSEVRVRLREDGSISARTLRRVRRELCGIEDCCCGITRGGEYHIECWPDGYFVVNLWGRK
jgi:hypothetical protein